MIRRIPGLATALLVGLIASGCQSYVDQNRSVAGAWHRGDVAGTADQYANRSSGDWSREVHYAPPADSRKAIKRSPQLSR